ncbi:hypothetical protein MGN70_012647 [Eutypa lata]|nr:hypothetical protein MGN70_012647 [Eutypa lata]
METWARRTTQAHPETPAEGSTLAIVYSSKRDAPDNVLYRAKTSVSLGTPTTITTTNNRPTGIKDTVGEGSPPNSWNGGDSAPPQGAKQQRSRYRSALGGYFARQSPELGVYYGIYWSSG